MLKTLAFSTLLIIATGCATGSHVITGTTRAPISADSVRVFSTMPANAEIIGLVNANSGRMKYAVEKLQSEAGELGANGIVITQQADAGISGYIVSGTAIFTH